MPERGQYDIVPRPRPFKPSGEPGWPVDAILATATTGDAVRVPHDKATVVPGKRRVSPRSRLLTLIGGGLQRRGYGLEWAPDGDSAIVVWAVKTERA